MVWREKKRTKPSTIVEYNQAKGYIDHSDQFYSYGNTLRRGKIVFELLTNTATVNSHRLYTLVVGTKLSIDQFRDAIVTSIFESQLNRGRCQVCYNKFTKRVSVQHAMKMSKQ
ncbi:hypothetical protein PR048_001727, partial [Dryococelus australis]